MANKIMLIQWRTWYDYIGHWRTGKSEYTERQSDLLGTSRCNRHQSNPDKKITREKRLIEWQSFVVRQEDILLYKHNFRQPAKKLCEMSKIAS